MTENQKYLGILVIQALDNLARFSRYHQLIEIAWEEYGQISDKSLERIEVLLDAYLCQSKPDFEDLKVVLEELQKLAILMGDIDS